jgi:hypothetical protein
MRKDSTFAGKRSNPGATADQSWFRERNQNSESVQYELGKKPTDTHWNPMRGSYQMEGAAGRGDPKAEARANPITWDGQASEPKVPRDAFRPSTQLQLQNFRKSGLMQEEYRGPTGPNSPKRASRAHYESDREMLAWAPQSAPPVREGRHNTAANSSANTAELLKWSEKKPVEVQPSADSASRYEGDRRQDRLRDMSGEQTKDLLAHGGHKQVDESQKKRQPLVQTREEQNQRKFNQLTSAMTVNKQLSDTYNQLFKARDRNAQGQTFQLD